MKMWNMWAMQAGFLALAAIAACAQIPSPACNTPATASANAQGYVSVVNNSGDQTILLCSITSQVTQSSPAAAYQFLACRNSTCADSYPVTPLIPGHANAQDVYNLPPNPTAQIVLRKGYGLYIYLSGTAQAVVQAIFGAY